MGQELCRGLRQQITNLVDGLTENDYKSFQLGLAHSLSRYKLKFSPEKVDTMIVQAIGLLDDLDKEINTYAMRVKEWYGWHFPEMVKLISDNLMYAQVIKKMGYRTACSKTDFSDILPEEIEVPLKQVAEVSMGTEIADDDLSHIQDLGDQVIAMMEYRNQLFEYLKSRMVAIAPNLTLLVGELVGARLISHAGSLMNLAKHPASTVQILGAEKALFRALKAKHDTPKYGLLYHASLVGQSAPQHKGKISRVLASKCALAIRYDALSEKDDCSIGMEGREKVEARLRALETGTMHRISGATKSSTTPNKIESGSTSSYNVASDVTIDTKKRKHEEENGVTEETAKPNSDSTEKPKKKKKKKPEEDDADTDKKKKKKKKKKSDDEDNNESESADSKKKKKKKKKKE